MNTLRKRLCNNLDDLTSRIVQLRDAEWQQRRANAFNQHGRPERVPACVLCQARRELECGHVYGRSHQIARWDVFWGGNCYTQCHTCNQRHNRNRGPYLSWYRQRFGAEALAALEALWHTHRKITDLELAQLEAWYRAILAGNTAQLVASLRVVYVGCTFDRPELALYLPAAESRLQREIARTSKPMVFVRPGPKQAKAPPAAQLPARKRLVTPLAKHQHQARKPVTKTTAASEKAAREARNRHK